MIKPDFTIDNHPEFTKGSCGLTKEALDQIRERRAKIIVELWEKNLISSFLRDLEKFDI